MKAVGAAWDVSYHFKHLRELYELPHLVNAAGDLLLAGVVAYLWQYGGKSERKRLFFIIGGGAMFFFGIFFDQWYHERFGVDLTIWSPAHLTLYAGSLIALLGTLRYLFEEYDLRRISPRLKKIFGLIFSGLILESLWFLLLQQEQGVVTEYLMNHGIRLADDELLWAVLKTGQNAYGNIPHWVYGTWAVMSLVAVFHFAQRLSLHRLSSTIIATFYVGTRLVLNSIFVFAHYPSSTVPYFILPIALAFDAFYNILSRHPLERDMGATAIPVLGVVLAGLINPLAPIHPPIPLPDTLASMIPAAALGYALAVIGKDYLFKKY
jgi:hypothetical protein